MRRARGKTASCRNAYRKTAIMISTSAKTARISSTNSDAYSCPRLASHSSRKCLRGKAKQWDRFNVTEDADLGYRLARDGYVSGVIGPPTFEEAPITLGAWLNQRTRWIKGHMQSWLVLMRDPVRAAREMGLHGFVSMQLMLGGGVIAAFSHGPLAFIVLIAALSPYNLLKVEDFILVVSGYSVAMLAALSACALSNNLSHARAALTMPLYWPLASLAAWRAFFDLLFRPHHWSKTAHGLSSNRQAPRARMTALNQRSDLSRVHIASTSPSL
jgi:cellulose synthase/poly-beta-1,6-N-acetylglucosamine synthase-like glycosyltransferase